MKCLLFDITKNKAMKFKCPNCNAPFDDYGLSQYSDHEMPCPNCNTMFKPHSIIESSNDTMTDEETSVLQTTLLKIYLSEESALSEDNFSKMAFADLYALGWYLILKGENDAGYKMGLTAVNAICNRSRGVSSEVDLGKFHKQLLLALLNGTDIHVVKMLGPHHEALKLILSLKNYKE